MHLLIFDGDGDLIFDGDGDLIFDGDGDVDGSGDDGCRGRPAPSRQGLRSSLETAMAQGLLECFT